MKRFALIGCSGYIAPRHMEAIKANGGVLVSACDKSDSAGILDRYAPDCRFTTNPAEFFQRQLYDVDYVVITTPNYLHFSHALWALKEGCDVILEKPVATGWAGLGNAEVLLRKAAAFENKVYPVVQLRYHPEIEALKGVSYSQCDVTGQNILNAPSLHDVEIDYAVWRGEWYSMAWKGHEHLSGGLLINLGVHLFDLCLYIWGGNGYIREATIGPKEASGSFRCSRAEVKWRLSTTEREPHRVFRIDNTKLDMSGQIGQLHGRVYSEILAGRGFELKDAAKALELIDRVKEKADGR